MWTGNKIWLTSKFPDQNFLTFSYTKIFKAIRAIRPKLRALHRFSLNPDGTELDV